jgi:hypothetical protein
MPEQSTRVIAKETLPNIYVHQMKDIGDGGIAVKLQIGHVLFRGVRYYPGIGGDYVTFPIWHGSTLPVADLTIECMNEVIKACGRGWALYGPQTQKD